MDHQERLKWASEQLEIFHGEIESWLKDNPYTTRVDIDRESQCIRIFPEPHIPLPIQWSFRIGDIVQSTRSSLDYLTYSISMRAPTPPDPDQIRKIQFPIASTRGQYWGRKHPKPFEGERKRRMKFVDDNAKTIIDGLQPYLAQHQTHEHPLAILGELSNIDKHRHLLLTAVSFQTSKVSFRGFGKEILGNTEIEWSYGDWGALDPDTALMIIRFTRVRIPEGDVKVDSVIAAGVAFDEAGPGLGFPVIDSLKSIQNFIRDEVFPPLDQYAH